MLVFVYGTLKRGFYNQSYLEDSHFIGEAITKDKYPMVKMEEYFPYLINDKNTGNYIKGEVFEITNTTLKKLDILEGYPALYTRETIEVEIQDDTIEVIVYFLNGKIDFSESDLLEEFIDS